MHAVRTARAVPVPVPVPVPIRAKGTGTGTALGVDVKNVYFSLVSIIVFTVMY